MAGTCDGLSALAWKLFADVFPPEPTPRGRGMPPPPFRKVVTTLLYVLSTGCRGCDLRRGAQGASTRAAPRGRWRWQDEGPLAARPARLLGLAEARGLRPWHDGAGEVTP